MEHHEGRGGRTDCRQGGEEVCGDELDDTLNRTTEIHQVAKPDSKEAAEGKSLQRPTSAVAGAAPYRRPLKLKMQNYGAADAVQSYFHTLPNRSEDQMLMAIESLEPINGRPAPRMPLKQPSSRDASAAAVQHLE